MGYIKPERGRLSFTCPSCGVLSRHYHWGYINEINANFRYAEEEVKKAVFSVSRCEHCSELCLWMGDELVHPNRGSAPLPNPEMPAEVKADYEEAAKIVNVSPRGAAALLRLAIQKLCIHLGGTGENINKDVALLVSQGLPVQVQRALDILRVIGNNAVHPGQIDANDVTLAEQLFPLVNVITEYMIDLPKRVNKMYDDLPLSARETIQKRDS